MTTLTAHARSRLTTLAIVLATVIGLTGCHLPVEGGTDFTVTNKTNQTLHFVGRVDRPGFASTGSPSDTTFHLAPGEDFGLRTGLTRGSCIYTSFTAYDSNGHVVATDPSPICEDKQGHGGTWTVTAK